MGQRSRISPVHAVVRSIQFVRLPSLLERGSQDSGEGGHLLPLAAPTTDAYLQQFYRSEVVSVKLPELAE